MQHGGPFSQFPVAPAHPAQGKCLIAAHTRVRPERCNVTPATDLWMVLPALQYRTLKNYRNPEYLGPRIGDKLIFS